MSGKLINLFMWAYQISFRGHIKILAEAVLKELGAETEISTLLVGCRAPNSNNRHAVCIEPEEGKWALSLFDGLLDTVELIYKNHDLQRIFYGDEPSMRDKPERMRQDSVRKAVANQLENYDKDNNVKSFCGSARRVGEYYVTPVIQIPNAIFIKLPPLPEKNIIEQKRGYGSRSLIHSAIYAVLSEATEELQRADPGRFTHSTIRNSEEIVRIAAKNFMHTPGLSINERYIHANLFDQLNLISSLMYEGVEGIGSLILINPKNTAVDFLVQFKEPVRFRDHRWVRKVLQMATTGNAIIADDQSIYGLGQLKKTHDSQLQDAFTVNFLEHHHWELRCGDITLLRSKYSVPMLPQEYVDEQAFIANYLRLFPKATRDDSLQLLDLLFFQAQLGHGSMVVVTDDAASEAQRLNKQGTTIVPIKISKALLQSISCIDGTILLDPYGICHAFGVILDGEANDECTPSRGSRYNSGVRYVRSGNQRRFAIVVSDDRTIDIIPEIRPLVSRSKLEKYISTFNCSTIDNYHESRKWLDEHRFYINADQCELLNSTITRLDNDPKEVGRIYIQTNLFDEHPDFDESYFTN